MNSLLAWTKRHLNILVFVIAAMSFLPILYCGMFNYASADEFSKSYTVHNVILAGGNALDVLWAAVVAAYDLWVSIEGTWSANFVMALQPSIFGEHAYAVTVPLCILYAGLGSWYLFREIFVEICGMSKRAFYAIFWAQLFLFIQYMPFIRGGMFWYVGMVHYIMPMCIALLMIAWMLKWFRTEKRRYLVYLILAAVYMGGSHYQHILIVLLTFLTGWVLKWIQDRRSGEGLGRCVHLLWIPFAVVLVGLYICVISPGNAVRGQETFGLNISAILFMPVSCVVAGGQHVVEYVCRALLLVVYGILLWFAGQRCMPAGEPRALQRIPAVVIAIYLFLLYAATEAPAIYAKDNPEGISGAYYDTVYHMLILVMTVGIPIIAARVPERFRLRMLPTTIVCLVLCAVFAKPAIKNSSTYICYDFITSGGLEDFIIQMEERVELLNDPALADVYVPEMNDQQGPFMHLQLSQDAGNYTNRATADFYRKNSVTAVPREEYYARYAEAQGHDIPEAYRELYSQ